ncbi:MAG: hypothetical protein FJ397_05660 [Verrucomicrobia bacterium]|nr:hypothetical protein [Verrucomicrobiota bacterium]
MHRRRLLRIVPWLVLVAAPLWADPAPAGVAILGPVAWSPADPGRTGAGEFEVFLRVAQLQRQSGAVGLVCVGDRQGNRAGGGERALVRAARSGVVVVKLAPGGAVAPCVDGLFLDGGVLGAEEARGILGAALARHGPPPAAADAERPTAGELASIRAHLARFQTLLTAAAGTRYAAR